MQIDRQTVREHVKDFFEQLAITIATYGTLTFLVFVFYIWLHI